MPVSPAHCNQINAVKLSITIKQNFIVIDRVS